MAFYYKCENLLKIYRYFIHVILISSENITRIAVRLDFQHQAQRRKWAYSRLASRIGLDLNLPSPASQAQVGKNYLWSAVKIRLEKLKPPTQPYR